MCEPQSGHDSRCCKRPHLPRARFRYHGCTRLQRRSRRTHIVYQDNTGPVESRTAPHTKRTLHVGAPSICREIRLRRCVPAALERVHNGQAEPARQVRRLVETAPPAPAPVKRNRDDDVRCRQDGFSLRPHHGAECGGDRPPAPVLECMKDLPERAIVVADRASHRDRTADCAAPRALPARTCGFPPGRQRITTHRAERWRQRTD